MYKVKMASDDVIVGLLYFLFYSSSQLELHDKLCVAYHI